MALDTKGRQSIPLGDGNYFSVPPDSGCWFHHSCLECPRPTCILDDGQPDRSRETLARRNQEIGRRFRGGESVSSIARALNMKYRTVDETLRRHFPDMPRRRRGRPPKGGDTSARNT